MSDEHGVVASSRLIAGLTLLSRILGYARECTYGYFFGTGPLLSAFTIAFMIPNLARRLFGEGALSAAFIPVFTRARRDRDADHAPRLAGGVLTLLVIILVAIVVVVEIGLLTANTIRPSLTLELTAIMLPFMAFVCLAAFLGGVLNTLGHFAAPAASPMILNLFVIAAILIGAYGAGRTGRPLIHLMCFAVLAAGVAQLLLQWSTLARAGFRPRLNRSWSDPDIREVGRFMAPMMIGLSTVQLNTMADKLIALWMVPDGQGPAVLNYAHFLYQLPLGVFGIAIATAVFPVMAARAADNDMPALTRIVVQGARLSFFIILPASVGLILIADPLITALFQRGEFGPTSTARVSRALVFYAVGLWAYALQHILVRAFYSLKDSKTPVRIALWVVAANVTLNLLLVGPMREAGVALATAVSAVIQVIALAWALHRRLAPADASGLLSSAIKTTISTAAMAICVWLIVGQASPISASSWPAIVRIAVAVPIGCFVVAVASRLMDASELTELLKRKRRTRTD